MAEAAGKSIARALAELPVEDWRIFHQVHRAGPGFAGIDHVAVGPQGVFVIHSETWTGAVDTAHGVLRCDGRRRPEPVSVTLQAARTVAGLLPHLPPDAARPVLCLTRPGSPAEPAARPGTVFGWVGETMVCSPGNLATMIRARPEVVAKHAVHETAQALGRAFHGTDEARPMGGVGGSRRTAPHRRRGSAVRLRRRNRTGAGSRRPGRTVLTVLVLVLLLGGVLALVGSPRLAEVGGSVFPRLGNPEDAIGEEISLRGRGRPHLDVIAGRPAPTRSRTPGERVGPRRVLLAVPLRIHNDGDEVWSPGLSARAALVDATGRSVSSEARFTRVAAGRVLRLGRDVPAGRTTRGVVVFETRRNARLSEVRLTVGPGLTRTLHWKVPRD